MDHNPETMRVYQTFLYVFLVAWIRSLDKKTGYKLPIDDTDRAVLTALITALQTNKDKVLALHAVLLRLFRARSRPIPLEIDPNEDMDLQMDYNMDNIEDNSADDVDTDAESDIDENEIREEAYNFVPDLGKFSDPMECFIALFHLTKDAKFQQPKEITPTFAKIKYFARITTLYEGWAMVKGGAQNLYL